MSLHTDRKAFLVAQAEDAVDRAWVRLQDALARFEVLEDEWLATDSAYVPPPLREARREAHLARKWHHHCVNVLHTAQAEAEAPTLWDD